MCTDPPSKKRDRDYSPAEREDLSDSKTSKRRRLRRRVTVLNVDNGRQGQVFSVAYSRLYGFVESVTFSEQPVRVTRTGRGAPHAPLPPPQYVVSVVFDCVSAAWFDSIVDIGTVAWDSVAWVANSCRAEFTVDRTVFDALNQRPGPVLGLPMPAIDEGTWWELALEDTIPPFSYIPVLMTVPQELNPVSTILSRRQMFSCLVNLTVPRNLARLRFFSHGWTLIQGPDDPPYPGR